MNLVSGSKMISLSATNELIRLNTKPDSIINRVIVIRCTNELALRMQQSTHDGVDVRRYVTLYILTSNGLESNGVEPNRS